MEVEETAVYVLTTRGCQIVQYDMSDWRNVNNVQRDFKH